jgi:hypothetical protein
MYLVNNTTFCSYMDAIKSAKAANANVILTTTGEVKWSPLPPVSAKRMRRYHSQMNAYNAQVGK